MRELTRLREAVILGFGFVEIERGRSARCGKPDAVRVVGRDVAPRRRFARTVALDPEIMLYDEPFRKLDPISFGRDCPLDQPRQQGFVFGRCYGNARR